MLSEADLISSILLLADNGDGLRPDGDVGEIPIGDWVADDIESGRRNPALSGKLVSEALLTSLAIPNPFFCLNFSSQLELLAF